jgi:putative transcriptional regulator
MSETVQNGSILIASGDLRGEFFEKTAVLVVLHTEEGSFGLVLNRPVLLPLSEVFSPLPPAACNTRVFHIGGPVGDEELHVVTLTDYLSRDETKKAGRPGLSFMEDREDMGRSGYPFLPGVRLGEGDASLTDILEQNSAHTKIYLGYSGWAPGQLAAEVKSGSWEVCNGVDIGKFIFEVSNKVDPDENRLQNLAKKYKL